MQEEARRGRHEGQPGHRLGDQRGQVAPGLVSGAALLLSRGSSCAQARQRRPSRFCGLLVPRRVVEGLASL